MTPEFFRHVIADVVVFRVQPQQSQGKNDALGRNIAQFHGSHSVVAFCHELEHGVV